MWRTGVFGPSLSGKTTLVKAVAQEYERKFKMRSIVLDPNLDKDWPKSAVVMNDEAKFWATIWASSNCLVIVEESSETIARNKDLIGVFTRLRHRMHKLIVAGHSGMALLPVMRQQFDTLYLFYTTSKAAKQWVEDFGDERLIEAVKLRQYEFLKCEKFKTPQKCILTLPRK